MTPIVEYIKAHKGIPVPARNLSETFGISGFEVRKVINSARSEGCPICSCHKGYYYSENEPATYGHYWHYDENGNIAVW